MGSTFIVRNGSAPPPHPLLLATRNRIYLLLRELGLRLSKSDKVLSKKRKLDAMWGGFLTNAGRRDEDGPDDGSGGGDAKETDKEGKNGGDGGSERDGEQDVEGGGETHDSKRPRGSDNERDPNNEDFEWEEEEEMKRRLLNSGDAVVSSPLDDIPKKNGEVVEKSGDDLHQSLLSIMEGVGEGYVYIYSGEEGDGAGGVDGVDFGEDVTD